MGYVITGVLCFLGGGATVVFILWRIVTKSASEWW